MPVPPILEIVVVWHPDDRVGEVTLTWLSDHFHGPTFSGLAGGAVEVYARSAGWSSPGAPPRPLAFMNPLPAGLQPAQTTAIVLVEGTGLARAVADDGDWQRYVEQILESRSAPGPASHPPRAFVYPLRDPEVDLSGSGLSVLLGRVQALPARSATDRELLCRELSQAISQDISRTAGRSTASADSRSQDRITVFVSHTKHHTATQVEDGPRLLAAVRTVLRETRLGEFFDAADLQAGSEWEATLEANLGRSALLMVRTDLYSSREWTQREVLIAKRSGLPVVALFAVREGEDRGSFLMDHVPVIPCPTDDPADAIKRALNRLVDETLKRVLWHEQSVYLAEDGFDWLPPNAPEPVTMIPWLASHRARQPEDAHFWVVHPDPPLGPPERDLLVELCQLAGGPPDVEILTPRTFATRGGRIGGSGDPRIVPRGELSGMAVGISVSDSADLDRLGLTERHCDMAVAELSRALLLAGAQLVYGGRLVPEGFSQLILDEVRRYAEGRSAFTLCLAEPEHLKLSDEQLREVDRRFGTSARLVCLDGNGAPVPIHARGGSPRTGVRQALTGMRRYITARCDARVLIGGRLQPSDGAMPGIVEEAVMSVHDAVPLYLASGFGGATALVAKSLQPECEGWVPAGFPHASGDGAPPWAGLLERELLTTGLADNGMTSAERGQLSATYRPGDIASLVVVALSRLRWSNRLTDKSDHPDP